jgi:hypothetical protein
MAEHHSEEIKATNISKEDRRFLQAHKDQLSDSTLRARWVSSPEEHAERDGQTLATRNHDVIKQWAEERKATPATVPDTEHDGRAGVLRFDFEGYGGKDLEHISLEEWFKPFDERELVFLFQERKSDGSQSNFFRLDNPDREDA